MLYECSFQLKSKIWDLKLTLENGSMSASAGKNNF